MSHFLQTMSHFSQTMSHFLLLTTRFNSRKWDMPGLWLAGWRTAGAAGCGEPEGPCEEDAGISADWVRRIALPG